MEISTLSPKTDEYEPTPEEENDYWCGKGSITFKVISYDKNAEPWARFEIEYLDYEGCVGGIGETIGIEYAINEGYIGDPSKLKLGWTYTYGDIEAFFTRGDGWSTDDDVDWYTGYVTEHFDLIEWIKAWWRYLITDQILIWRRK